MLSIVGAAAVGLVTLAVSLGVYVYIAFSLPSPDQLQDRAASFVSSKIYDRNGELLYVINDPAGGRRTLVSLDEIPMSLRNATIATEDPTFYSNPGFNPLAIARAFYHNIREGEIVSGASTITQQLVKALFVGRDVTFERKVKEAVLAAEITRTYDKDKILEIYLNEIYYGNMAYGVAAAAETYFDKPVRELSLAESALLVGIVPSPGAHDPYQNPEAAIEARKIVLDLMVKHGYITTEEAAAAHAEPLNLAPLQIEINAPHFVFYVRQLLEQQYGTDMLYRSGLQVETTLDLRMQTIAEQVAREHVATLAAQNATNASLVAIDPQTGEIRAMLGSADFRDESIDGQVNVALRPRQPGSSIKPFTYLAAFERGWSPATMIMDVNTQFPDGANPPYEPSNYDLKEHGPVSVRRALACSYNIPAVKALQYVGLPSLLEMANRLGVASLNRSDYGLSLTLGGGDVTLLEMTGAYSAFAAGGMLHEPVAILRIKDSAGNTIYQYNPGEGRPVMDPRQAYLITDILSDNDARTPAFGPNSALNLSWPAAGKTGTTNDYRDAWTIGYTTSLVTGVWVGNSDNTEMAGVAGSRGAGPIWHNFMEAVLPILEAEGKPAEAFPRPAGIVDVEVCAVSGQRPTDDCPERRTELFIAGNEPQEDCSVHTKLRVCTVSNKLAGEFCPSDSVEEKVFESYPPEAADWAQRSNLPQPPTETCDVHTSHANISIRRPREGDTVDGRVEIRATAEMSDMQRYRVEYGIGDDPQGWGLIEERESHGFRDRTVARWNTKDLDEGVYTLRILAIDSHGNAQEARVKVRLRQRETKPPTQVATATATATETVMPTPTESRRQTPTVNPTPTPEAVTPVPADTPVPEETPTESKPEPPEDDD